MTAKHPTESRFQILLRLSYKDKTGLFACSGSFFDLACVYQLSLCVCVAVE